MASIEQETGFAAVLRLVMSRLNLSRVELAQRVAVDKSVVRRWVLGASRPSDANLSLLTDIVAAEVPGFIRDHWAAAPGAVAALLGLGGEPGPASGLLPRLSARAAAGVANGLDLYGGIWAQFYTPVTPPGGRLLFCGGVLIDAEDGMLRYLVSDGPRGVWTGGGPAFCVDGRMWVLIEEHRGRNDLCAIVYNGTSGQRAMIVDGLAMARAANAGGVPVCGRFTLVRLADLEGGAERIEALFEAVCARAGALSLGDLAAALPDDVAGVLTGETVAPAPRHQPFVMTLPAAVDLMTDAIDIDLLPLGPGGPPRRRLLEAVRDLFAEALESGR